MKKTYHRWRDLREKKLTPAQRSGMTRSEMVWCMNNQSFLFTMQPAFAVTIFFQKINLLFKIIILHNDIGHYS
jgi:hypothetical protein